MDIKDLIYNVGKDTIVLTKSNGEYKVFTQTDSLLEATRELVTLYKKIWKKHGKTDQEIARLLGI